MSSLDDAVSSTSSSSSFFREQEEEHDSNSNSNSNSNSTDNEDNYNNVAVAAFSATNVLENASSSEVSSSSSSSSSSPYSAAASPLLANARDHTYLPGISQALGTRHYENNLEIPVTGTAPTPATAATTTATSAFAVSGPSDPCLPATSFPLIVWHTKELVVFPGSTVPLRLDPDDSRPAHQRALQVLHQQIITSRQQPGKVPAVYLGIWSSVPYETFHPDSSSSRRNSSSDSSDEEENSEQSRQRRRRRTREQLSTDDSSSSDSDNRGLDSVQWAPVRDDTERQLQERPPRRRQSWTRFGMGPRRLRRLSERVQEELNNIDWSQIVAVDDNDGENRDVINDRGDNTIIRNQNGSDDPRIQPTGQMNNNTHQGGDDEDSDGHSDSHAADDSNSLDTRERSNSPGNRRRRKRRGRRPQPPDPWQGQIGTLATIVFTHHDETEQAQIQQQSSISSLVLTARAVGRFRIVGDATHARRDPYAHARRSNASGHLMRLMVEEWPEKPLFPLYNQSWLMSPSSTATLWPQYLTRMDPLALVKSLRKDLEAFPSLSGLLTRSEKRSNSLPRDPIAFSYWLATNLPSLRLRQKLKILQKPTAAERLLYLQAAVHALSLGEAVISCGHCQLPLARARQIFTVGGADGTTGAYVNPNGIVHETLTVRSLDMLEDEADLWLLGGPETKDSWFPGYAWTITNCGLCGFHLGWKFNKTNSSTRRASGDRPSQFFGLRAGQIQSKVPTRRVSASIRSARR